MGFLKKSNSSKSDSDKSDSKKTWFSSRSTKKGSVKDTHNKQQTQNPATRSDDRATGPSSLVKHTESFDKRILETEQNIQTEIKQASNRKDLRLQSSGGVLLFEGMTKEEFDEYSMKELRENDASIDNINKNETDFVNVSGNYDPVKSGFYSKKSKNYYDSDDEDKLASNQNSQGIGNNPAFCGCFGTLAD
jgi:hypothetical protein